MAFVMNLLRKLLYKLGGGTAQPAHTEMPVQLAAQVEPRIGKIDQEVVFAMKDGYVVLIVDHQFDGVPSWIEWDESRKIVSFTQMGGDMDEMNATIKAEFITVLMDTRKVLLISNDNTKKIVHFVPFLARM